jgi:hypothetical protein
MGSEDEGLIFNLLDTPGHPDCSEDAYRSLTTVDSAVMVLDAAAGSNPGIDQFQPAIHKIPDVSRRQSGTARAGDGGDARVGFRNRPPGTTPARGDVRELTSRGAVEGQYSTRQILGENQVYNRPQGLSPPAFGQQGDAV